MNINDLKPIGALAQNYGAKILLYGQAGCGKTPLITTAPNPVVCVTEPGILSLKGTNNIPAVDCYTGAAIEDFFKWALNSSEAKQFETICVDSISQVAEIFLKDELPKHKNKMQAYGMMLERTMNIVNGLYYAQGVNVYMTAKLDKYQDGEVWFNRPAFKGQQLSIEIPHLFDEVLFVEMKIAAGGVMQPVINTRAGYNFIARDRSGKLLPTEEMNIGKIIQKINN